MIILTIKTDNPTAEIGLFNQNKQIDYLSWQAHRTLSKNLLGKIEDLLSANKFKLSDIKGIVCFKGPGSFTGLRIGLTVANTLSYGLDVPVIGSNGGDWINSGVKQIQDDKNHKIVVPFYGQEPNITKPKN